ncbi:unnamed protein product [Coccothraustes coccothraustes]
MPEARGAGGQGIPQPSVPPRLRAAAPAPHKAGWGRRELRHPRRKAGRAGVPSRSPGPPSSAGPGLRQVPEPALSERVPAPRPAPPPALSYLAAGDGQGARVPLRYPGLGSHPTRADVRHSPSPLPLQVGLRLCPEAHGERWFRDSPYEIDLTASGRCHHLQ